MSYELGYRPPEHKPWREVKIVGFGSFIVRADGHEEAMQTIGYYAHQENLDVRPEELLPVMHSSLELEPAFAAACQRIHWGNLIRQADIVDYHPTRHIPEPTKPSDIQEVYF